MVFTLKKGAMLVIFFLSVITSIANAWTIPGTHKTTGSLYADKNTANGNVTALEQLSPTTVAAHLSPFIIAGINRQAVITVEPVLHNGVPDTEASGRVLAKAIATASTRHDVVLVKIDAGQYTLPDSTVTLPANVSVKGEGDAATFITATDIISNSPGISALHLSVHTFTQNRTGYIHDMTVVGGFILNGGATTLSHIVMPETGQTAEAVRIENGKEYTLRDVTITTPLTAIDIADTSVTDVLNCQLSATRPIIVGRNAKVLVANTVYRGDKPLFFGGAGVSNQRCHNNINGDTGLAVPQHPAGNAASCFGNDSHNIHQVQLTTGVIYK